MIYFIWINKNANLLSILISNEIAFLLDVFKSEAVSKVHFELSSNLTH